MSKVRVPIDQMLNRSNQSDDVKGLRCPKCKCPVMSWPGQHVTHTRPRTDGTIRRRHVCRACAWVWWTVER